MTERSPETTITLPPKAAALKRTVSSTQLLAHEILAQLRQKSSSPPKGPAEDEEDKKKTPQ